MPPHARFSSKRRVRYGDSESSSRGKLFSFMKQKQKAQLDKLRASLASEQIAKMSVPPSSEEEGDTVMADDDASESGNNTGKSAKEFSRMRKLKEAKQERVKHLPLFKPNSPLLRHFGDQTLGDYDQLPTTAFHGQVLVIHSPQEEAIYASYLRAQKVFGVDTEAKPDFHTKKQMNPVCLIQLATLDRAFIYRLQRGQPLPPVLQELLANPDVLKIGHSLHDDFRQMKASKLVNTVNSTVDTLPIANKLGCLRPGLKTLCQLFLGGVISKEMQVSNWEATRLSPAQIKYAATDAWAPLRVLLEMIQLEETRLLLRTKSYNSFGRTVVDDDHDKLLGLLHSFVLNQQPPEVSRVSGSSADQP
uniref:3'-5' exonuclease domain-containing protein n=1 Tax=Globisporangium ultimum (strain ATCC 200006 / CBS 805.95 / DAOM BR144) TaxID=431595 RepID=K3WUD1_GLOUD